jgi:SAM-dependent methyltransferase
MLDAANLAPGQRVLDVGCGCGGTTFSAADRLGAEGRAVGIDISAPMIARAQQHAAGDSRLRFVCADAASYTFGSRFDTLISRHGLMFFEEPVPALEHLRRQLRPGARLAFVAWRKLAENDWLSVPLQTVRLALGAEAEPAPPVGPSPFAFADRDYARSVLADAGFRSIAVEGFDAPVRMSEAGAEGAVAFVKIHAGPVGRLLAEVDEAQRERALRALEEHLALLAIDGVVELKGAAWLVTAAAP